MDVTVRSDSNGVILDLDGKFLTMADNMALRTAVRAATRDQPGRIVLDLGKVSYIDSCGIGELVNSLVYVRNQGGSVALLDPPQRIRKLLVIAKLDGIFEILENEQPAVADGKAILLEHPKCG
jgi:anti-sigma B factor antagonist